MHKRAAMVSVMMLGLISAGCGAGTGSGTSAINGTWDATLTNLDGSPAFAFTTTFAQSGGGNTLTFKSLSFSTSGTCFASPTTETGSFSFGGDYNGNVTGTFTMTISTIFPGGQNNVLTLQGGVNGNAITGTWTLTGTGSCTGSGNFTFDRVTNG